MLLEEAFTDFFGLVVAEGDFLDLIEGFKGLVAMVSSLLECFSGSYFSID